MLNTSLTAVMTAVVIATAPTFVQAQALSPDMAVQSARASLQAGGVAAALAKASAFDAFQQRAGADLRADAAGESHLRFDRTYQGIPVLGGDIIVHLAQDGQVSRVSSTLAAEIDLPSVVPSLDRQQVVERAERWFRKDGSLKSTSAELMVVAMPDLVKKPTLAWVVKTRGVRCGQPSWMHYVIDAHSGVLHSSFEGQVSARMIECKAGQETAAGISASEPVASGSKRRAGKARPLAAANGTGKSLYSGDQPIGTDKISDTEYWLRDTTRGSHFVSDYVAGVTTPLIDADNTWGDNTVADRATVAADAAYGQRMTWDYYLNVHGRNGIDNHGSGYLSSVHFEDPIGTKVDNAFWDPTADQMWYGDGDAICNPLVSLDVAGHEMTHGVTAKTAGLVYAGESGGLNEATSDIFGTMVEFYAANPNDPPDYTLFEKFMKSGVPDRFMYKPSQDTRSRDCWAVGTGALNPHLSSGIGNHFYYLLAEGSKPSGKPASPVCKHNENSTASDTIVFKGMGRSAAERIWYHALTTNMTASTDFKGARLATLESAKSLFGDDSENYRRVDYAWLAVNVVDIPKATTNTNNRSKAMAQIVAPAPELVLMGRRGVAGKTSWFAVNLDAGKSVEAKLTAGDGSSNFDLIGLDPTGKKQLAASKNAGGAKESITVQNTGTARKLFYITVPYVGGDAAYSLRLKML